MEFSLLLPLLILLFGLVVEGGRIMWSYQTAVAGVRDAARYLARVVPANLCQTDPSGASLVNHEAPLKTRIETSTSGTSVMPSLVTVQDLSIVLVSCTAGYRVPEVAIVEVTATINIQLPLNEMLEVTGSLWPASITTDISDQARVFGT